MTKPRWGCPPFVVDRLFEFLRRISQEGTALLIAEQHVYRALDLCDRVYLLNHGRMVFSGTPEELQALDIFERYLGAEAAINR